MIDMTVEEAIHVIQSNRPTSGYTMLCEALDMAIAALREYDGRMTMPCKAGDMVYVTDLTDGDVEECKVVSICIDENGEGSIEYAAPPDHPAIVSVECRLDEIGKTVFLTREEAAAALEGAARNDQ